MRIIGMHVPTMFDTYGCDFGFAPVVDTRLKGVQVHTLTNSEVVKIGNHNLELLYEVGDEVGQFVSDTDLSTFAREEYFELEAPEVKFVFEIVTPGEEYGVTVVTRNDVYYYASPWMRHSLKKIWTSLAAKEGNLSALSIIGGILG